jgi:sigma-B regulation protein RsbU (phosphoserine phosphatase)
MDPSGRDDRVRRIEAVTDIALSQLDTDKLMQELLERVRELLSADTATVLLLDASGGELVATAAAGIEEEVRQGVRVPMGRGFAGRVAAQRQPVLIERVDPGTVVNRLLWEAGLQVLLGVPLLVAGQLIGVLHVGSRADRKFTEDDVQLLQIVADRIALATQAQASSAERMAARALQRSLLPSGLPTVAGLELAGRYVPGAQTGVGGDWYDVFPLPGDRLGIVMGDVVGHGLPAAVVMGRLRSALRAYALDNDDPSDVLRKLDRKACHFEVGAMATVAYAVADRGGERLRLSLAGHLPPVLATPEHPGRLLELSPDPPIGLSLSGFPRHSHEITLPPGSVLCLYTDGLVERRSRPIDTGLDLLCRTVRPEAPELVCAAVMAALTGNEDVADDVAVLVAHRTDTIG